MFLSVSQSRFTQTDFAKPALTVALLVLSLAVHAGSSEAVEEAADKASDMSSTGQPTGQPAQASNSPRWPQHQQGNKVIIPPPPPGPYNSTALSDYSVAAPANRVRRPAPRRSSNYNASAKAPAAVPMATFSPDRPWPKNLRPVPRQPEQRVPGQGSHPAKPPSASFYAPKGNRNYGRSQKAYQRPYMNAPGMNAPGMNTPRINNMGLNSSRWMPNMTMTPPGPYNNRLNYAPNYGSNYGPRYYGRPAINNNATRSANPAYR